MINSQLIIDLHGELIVDTFAGIGGVSDAIEEALGRIADIAVNHNDDAVSGHWINHPQTQHYLADVFEVCPRTVTNRRPVGLFHLSPDCTHHSQAAGGQPRNSKIRALSWVGVRWAGQVRPRVMTLENVKQILQWCPLIAKRDKVTKHVVKIDGTVAAPGEYVPRHQQFLVPDPKRIGKTWKRFVKILQQMGYVVEWRILCAADFGAPTTRERLFMVARCDGRPIVWPTPTHAKKPARRQKPWRAAATCIDWSIACPSIFECERPLAEATLRRIVKGIRKYVIESGDPFIVPIAHYNGSEPVHNIHEPLRTVTAYPKGGAFAVCSPTLIQTGYGERFGQAPRVPGLDKPLGTIVAGGGKHALVSTYLMQANGGYNQTPGHDVRRPMTTVTNTGSQQQLVTALLASYYTDTSNRCRDARSPMATVTTENRIGLIECKLSPEAEAGALRVSAFLMRYYGEGGQWSDARDPAPTITTKDRMALITVTIQGQPYVITDIGLRMLTPRELFNAQGFPADYIIDQGHDGRVFSKATQVRLCGNSVSPPPMIALLRANVPELAVAPRKVA